MSEMRRELNRVRKRPWDVGDDRLLLSLAVLGAILMASQSLVEEESNLAFGLVSATIVVGIGACAVIIRRRRPRSERRSGSRALLLTPLAAFGVGVAVYLALEGRWLMMVSVLLTPIAGGALVVGLARVTSAGRRTRDWIAVSGGAALSALVVLLAVLDSGPT